MFDVKLTTWRGGEVSAMFANVTANVLGDFAGKVLHEANEMCPYDTGKLKSTGEVTFDGMDNACISYDTPYAAYLHEHPELNFRNGKEGKWLEKALHNNEKELLQVMENAYKGLL